jgi:hypothetical protein
MPSIKIPRPLQALYLVFLILAVFDLQSLAALSPHPCGTRQSAHARAEWTSPARWRSGIHSTSGTISIAPDGVRFAAARGQSQAWLYEEIRTFYAAPRRLIISGYANRRWKVPGTRSFHFDLKAAMPPEIAARLAKRVGKPSRNADPLPHAGTYATLAARHSGRTGGTNGVLRFHPGGIDYVTASSGDSRSWRWADIQTVANSDPYHFRVAGFLETYDFDLKQPLSRHLFDRIWDAVYGRSLQVRLRNGGDPQ